jgi:hypothetical protein
MAEESSISKGDDGLRQVTQHNGVRDTPNLTIRNGGFNHGTKLGISSGHQNYPFQFFQTFFFLSPRKNVFLHLSKNNYT